MTYEQVKHLKPAEFKRLCGVQPATFAQMVAVLHQAEQQKQPGRPSKLSVENQLLLTLEYWREYRTYFHIAQSWGIYESTAYRIICRVENTLMKSAAFHLPGKKKLLEPEHEIEVAASSPAFQKAGECRQVVVDVTESPIERPKKTETVLQWQKETAHPQVSSDSQPVHPTNYLYGTKALDDNMTFICSKPVKLNLKQKLHVWQTKDIRVSKSCTS